VTATPATEPPAAPWAAIALNAVVALALLGVGIDYMASTEPKHHHMQVLDRPWADIDPRVQTLIMTLMKGTGLLAVSTAVSLGVLIAVPLRRRQPWSRWAVLLVAGVTLVPTLVGTFNVRAETEANAPYWPHLAMIACLGVAFWLTRDFAAPRTSQHLPEESPAT